MAKFFIAIAVFSLIGFGIYSGLVRLTEISETTPPAPTSTLPRTLALPRTTSTFFTIRQPEARPVLERVLPNLREITPPMYFSPATTTEERTLETPILPIPGPDIETFVNQTVQSNNPDGSPIDINNNFLSFLEKISKAAEITQNDIEKKINLPGSPIPGASSQLPKTLTKIEEIKLDLTAKEFHFIYPDALLKTILESQSFIKQIDPSYQSLAKIKNDADVRFIQEKIITALLTTKTIDQETAKRYLTTIRFTLPNLQKIEIEARRKQSFNQNNHFFNKTALTFINFPKFITSLMENKIISSDIRKPKTYFLLGLLEKIREAAVPAAKAAVCGACWSYPLCFVPGAPTGLIGVPTWTFACVCGGCYYGLGCLDRCNNISAGRGALWDPTTGICGCG